MHPSTLPNLCLRIVKWPTALIAVVALPFSVTHLIHSPLARLSFGQYQWFCMGAVSYFLLWLVIFRRRFMGAYLSTFEHELTHAIFAWLTLHQVTGLTVTWRHGGVCTFKGSGGGNWLIYIGPYWFPTIVIPALCALLLLETSHPEEMQTLVGICVAYQHTSTWRETHLSQPDLKETGLFFAISFLPTANLMTYGSIALFTLCGPKSSWEYLRSVWQGTLSWLFN